MSLEDRKLDRPAILRLIKQEAAEGQAMAAYDAVDRFWICLVKLATLQPRRAEEHEQVASFLRMFSRDQARHILAYEAVDALIDLEPPLETVLADLPGERLYPFPAGQEVTRLRQRRANDPKAALAALLEILQRIRDKRAHGFKTPNGPRDHDILTAAAGLLKRIIETGFEVAAAQDNQALG